VTATERLIRALASLPAGAPRDRLIEDARAGEFHDFRSSLDMPKRALVDRLDDYRGRPGEMVAHLLAERVKNGEFDESEEEARAWWDGLPAQERAHLREQLPAMTIPDWMRG
jgi:hypothetical protein